MGFIEGSAHPVFARRFKRAANHIETRRWTRAGDCCHGDEIISYLYQPAFSMDDALREPAEHYTPQPGDIFLATDKALLGRPQIFCDELPPSAKFVTKLAS